MLPNNISPKVDHILVVKTEEYSLGHLNSPQLYDMCVTVLPGLKGAGVQEFQCSEVFQIGLLRYTVIY